MISRLVEWAVNNAVVVLLLACALALFGSYAFVHVNVEAYPDPAPAIVEVIAQYPGASAEEVERQVTIPLEISLAGMPGLKYTRSKSLFGLAHLRNQFEYGVDYERAKQEVLNRLTLAQIPASVSPQISPASPIGEIYRYILTSPKDGLGRDIYSSNDLKALQDWTLEREIRRVPGVAGVVGFGGTVKRYEIHPDPDRLKEYGITLEQLEKAITDSNANVGGNYSVQGGNVQVIRAVGLIGGGEDPMVHAASLSSPAKAVEYLRAEERRRIREIRQIVITSTNNVPIRVEHVVEGGPHRYDEELGREGVIVGHQTRQGQVGIARPVVDALGREVLDEQGRRILVDEADEVLGIVLLRKGQESLPAIKALEAKVQELNDFPGKMLPGVRIEPFYVRTSLIDITTETVHENLVVGLALVIVVLLMFLSNIRSALIVAINIPLALLFAFSVLYLRGKSANLLSIGAVDFGIIVDSSVIMVENIYRRMSSGDSLEWPLKQRIIRASNELGQSLFYSTLIKVCALLPLFTMQGPEGQIFGPMADTYAFALGGALLLALTLSPVLCLLFFGNLKEASDNALVRALKGVSLRGMAWFLDHRILVCSVMVVLVTIALGTLPFLGREFMPELEEGAMLVRGTFPVNVSLDEVARNAKIARRIMMNFREIKLVSAQIGRPDDGTDPTGYYNMECSVPLEPRTRWPNAPGKHRPRTREELIDELDAELSRNVVGVNWDFSQLIRDNVLESLSGVKGENSVKIFGPDLDELEKLAQQVVKTLKTVDGIADPGLFRIKGQTNLVFPIDRDKCAQWSVSVSDLEDVISTAVGGAPFSKMIEGEKKFDITLRWPEHLRENAQEILEIPVDVVRNQIVAGTAGMAQTPISGAGVGLSPTGTSLSMPALTGSTYNAAINNLSRVPRRRLRDLVTPVNELGQLDPHGSFVRTGASTISREHGNRFIALKFGVRDRDLASTVADAKRATAPLLKAPYRAVWSGEFQQMEEAEVRIVKVASMAFVLILVILYLAFYSLLDVILVCSNVVTMSLGGLLALYLTGLNFNISAAVGFISILGVAMTDGLIKVSSMNHLRALHVPLREAILGAVEKRVRPVTMTLLAAILGLLPAAFSTRIGAQSQRPLAIVVVGGMLTTLVLFNLLPLLYSFYGGRDPNPHAGSMEH